MTDGDTWAPVAFSPAASKRLQALIDAANENADQKIERWRERRHLLDIGVDPDRVIDGELGQPEIEG